MKIIILGAGQVGASVATNLASEANDITIVDVTPSILQDLQDRLDIRTIVGHAAHPEILASAGADDADMCLSGSLYPVPYTDQNRPGAFR
jgi:trk system potassium uptake protein TrkA